MENKTGSEIFDKLTDRQRRAIPFIVGAPNIREGCRAAGITPTTFHEWTKGTDFADAVDTARDEMIRDAMHNLKAGVGKAVDKLLTLVESESDEVARKAATSILEMVMKMRESEEIEERIESIERVILERKVYR